MFSNVVPDSSGNITFNGYSIPDAPTYDVRFPLNGFQLVDMGLGLTDYATWAADYPGYEPCSKTRRHIRRGENGVNDEERFIIMGRSSEPRMLVVVHCFRKTGSAIRIISARRAGTKEQKPYAEKKS